MGKIFAICDLDRLYVKNLVQYINNRQTLPLKLQAFTSPELLKEYAGKHELELLLISTEAMDEEIAKLPIGKIVLLTEDGMIEVKGFATVNRYQASGNLVREVMQHYGTGNMAVALAAAKLATTRLIGVYSPVKRCGKTSLALALGQVYAEKSRVLYINLEDFSGFRELLQRDYRMDISDLIYFYREEKESAIMRAEQMAEKLKNIEYLPPAACTADIRAVKAEEWSEWILLLLQSKYDVIIVEPGEFVEGVEEILSLCDKIYAPVLDDAISRAKLLDYENYLLLSGWEALKGRIKRQTMPSDDGRKETGVLEYMESDEIKRIAEQLVREEEHD